ncbi:HAMP domain-containing sensor histidine kinase [Kangiella sp. TOML190]|uniref:sensor histidine kinase n=1 Tax=Kangiella sp. TOML190 TaxID=2931351 RepID=UPI00203EFD68|nr:HAMP domain-containing sensor histidine kinase [Kangiella sp. TOML190]
MSIGKLLRLALLSITLIMVIGYTWLMEGNLASGVLLSSEIRLNRTADAWIKNRPDFLQYSQQENLNDNKSKLPADGTPIVYTREQFLPATVKKHLPEKLVNGQFTIIETDELGLLNVGYLLHLFRTLPSGQDLHVVQRLMLSDYEVERVQQFDVLMDKRALIPGALFVFTTLFIIFLFGRHVSKTTTRLLIWFENLSIQSLPDKPPKLSLLEMNRIAEASLDAVKREAEAVEHRHRFLRFASHELRTPLAIASANTELLSRHGVDVKGVTALARLEESLKNMRSLTEALLWLGRGEASLPAPEPVDLLSLVSSIIEENSTQAKNNNVVVEVVKPLNKPIVQPRVLLMILCSNLIDNAIRYTRDGRVEIRLSEQSIEIENRGNQLGDGIAGSGHGLGLQLVAWVVERANWQWEQDGGEMFRCHRICLSTAD